MQFKVTHLIVIYVCGMFGKIWLFFLSPIIQEQLIVLVEQSKVLESMKIKVYSWENVCWYGKLETIWILERGPLYHDDLLQESISNIMTAAQFPADTKGCKMQHGQLLQKLWSCGQQEDVQQVTDCIHMLDFIQQLQDKVNGHSSNGIQTLARDVDFGVSTMKLVLNNDLCYCLDKRCKEPILIIKTNGNHWTEQQVTCLQPMWCPMY